MRTFRPNIPPGADPERFQAYEIGARYTTLEQHLAQPRKYEPMTRSRLQVILKENVQTEEPEDEETNALMTEGDTSSDRKKKSLKRKKQV